MFSIYEYNHHIRLEVNALRDDAMFRRLCECGHFCDEPINGRCCDCGNRAECCLCIIGKETT